MTQAVGNTLNNLEQLLLSQKEAQKLVEKPFSGMDKDVDFKKIFDGKLEKSQNTIEDLKKMSLSDKNKEVFIKVDLCNMQDKEAVIAQESLISIEDFKEILDKEIDQANVETSLDLTLAKDISEIISQLKEAIEDTVKIIDETKTSDEFVDDETKASLDGLIDICDKNVSATLIEEPNAEDLDSSLEHIVNLANKITSLNSLEGKLIEFNEQNSDGSLNLDTFELTQNEIIEFAETNIDETITNEQTKENSSMTQNLELDENIIKELKIESLSAQTDSSNDSTLMQQQTPEEHAVKVAINANIEGFELKLESAQSGQNIQQVVQKPVDVNPSRILDQVTKHLEGLQNGNKVNIVLNPDSLGKVNVQLMTTKDGLTAQFTVTTQEARDMLTKGLDGLKEALGTHGVTVDNVSVKFTETQKSEYNQDWTEQEGSRGGNKKQEQRNREEKQKDLFEKMLAQTANEENGNV